MKPSTYSLVKSENRPARNYCQKCSFYLDGHQVVDEDRQIHFSFYPGTQFHRWTKGTLYQRIGVMTPCTCAAGVDVDRGYRADSDADMVPWPELQNTNTMDF